MEIQYVKIMQTCYTTIENRVSLIKEEGEVMKILVCIKQVVDASKLEVDPSTGRINRSGANSILNPCDRNALEAALALKEKAGGTVTVISMGPPQAGAVLLEAVSMGADEAYLATDRAFGGADTLATSYTLAAAVRKLGNDFDLIFCGQESLDSNTAQVGPELASMLGLSDISAAVDFKWDNGKAIVTRQVGEGCEVLELRLPALVTAASSLNIPRYPSVSGILKKYDTEVHYLTAADLDVDPERIGLKGSPTQVKGVRTVVPPKKENLKIKDKTPVEAAALLAEALAKVHIV